MTKIDLEQRLQSRTRLVTSSSFLTYQLICWKRDFFHACNTTSLVEVNTSNKQRRIRADKRSDFERGDRLYCLSYRKNNCSLAQCRVGKPFSATGERKYGTLNFGFLVIWNTWAIIQCVWLHLRKMPSSVFIARRETC